MNGTIAIAILSLVGTIEPPGALAQNPPVTGKTKKENQAVVLKAGDLAPSLMVSKWLQGPEVPIFVPGKVYVVHFWAPWCKPCVSHMPQLSALQAQYREQGVSVIGYTTRDIRGGPSNTEADVTTFLKKRGADLRYAVAYADRRSMADAWLLRQDAFWIFVIDKSGRVAYKGHPMFLELVIPKVLAGNASAQAIADEMTRIIAEYEAMHENLVSGFKAGDPAPALKGLKEFEAKYPAIADTLPLAQAKLSLLPKFGAPGEGKAYAKFLVAKAIAAKDLRLLYLIHSILRDQKEDKNYLPFLVDAAEAYVRIDTAASASGMLRLAEAFYLAGDTAKARQAANKAIEALVNEPPADWQALEKEARRFGATK